jgi:recombinational DNA repair protein (RecF pathway)
MSHHLYHTDAFVLNIQPRKEADVVLTLFTEQFGLVYAVAAGARYLKSKLRYTLQKGGLIYVTLVQGKAGWRATNASFKETVRYANQKELMPVYVRILALVERLVKGEEQHRDLFLIILSFHNFVLESKNADFIHEAEIVTVYRIINALGYCSDGKEITEAVSGHYFDSALFDNVSKYKKVLIKSINDGLKVSQL